MRAFLALARTALRQQMQYRAAALAGVATQLAFGFLLASVYQAFYAGGAGEIRIRQTVSDGEVKVEVIDHGEGIPPDKLPLVWDRYYKIDRVHRRSAVGTGLGLSIVRGVLELHHARYGVESEVGKGSDFWFILPVSPDALPADSQTAPVPNMEEDQ